MIDLQLLQGCGLFAGLSDEQLQLLGTFSTRTQVEKGDVIVTEGRPARHLYTIQKGKVGMEMPVPKPNGVHTRPMVVAALGPGDAFGWSALVDPYLLTLSAKAMEQCDLVAVEAEALRETVQRYKDLGFVVLSNLTRLLAQRLALTRQALVYERGWVTAG